MDGIYVGFLGCGDDLVDTEVALDRRWRTDAVGFVCISDVQGCPIGVGVDGDRAQTQLATGSGRDSFNTRNDDF
jgi:hypothetical protein